MMIEFKFYLWDNEQNTEVIKEDPSWEDVKQAFLSLDGKQHDELAIVHESGATAVINGGIDRHVIMMIYLYEGEYAVHTLIDRTQEEVDQIQSVRGVATPLPGIYVVPQELALQALEYFYHSRRPDPQFEWEEHQVAAPGEGLPTVQCDLNEMSTKWSTEQIRERYDNAVTQFANLEEGQAEIVDGSLMFKLACEAAACVCPSAKSLLDLGCGTGLYSMRMLESMPEIDVTLLDLSDKMLEYAKEEVSKQTQGTVQTLHGDIREVDLGSNRYDIVLAGAVLHHLREAAEWEAVFQNIFRCLRGGGSFWIVDMVTHSLSAVQELIWKRYADYLTEQKNAQYSNFTLHLIQEEDSPRSLIYQLDLLRSVGFAQVEILHKSNCFAAFGAIKVPR